MLHERFHPVLIAVQPDQEASVLSSLSAEDRSVLLTELLRAHPELTAEAETITTTLLRAGDDRQIIDDVAGELRGLRISELAARASDQQDGPTVPSRAMAAEMLARAGGRVPGMDRLVRGELAIPATRGLSLPAASYRDRAIRFEGNR